MTRPAVFLDRDGVLIENRDDYVKSKDEVSVLPGASQAMRRLARSEYALVLVSNQSAVGRGLVTLEQANRINDHVVQAIVAAGGRLDASYLCPHAPEAACDCRKPAPGMLLRAAHELQLDPGQSFMVGDAASDMEAARAAGVRGVLVKTGRGAGQAAALTGDQRAHTTIVEDLSAAVDHILGPGEPSA